MNFLDIPAKFDDLKTAKNVVLKIPYEQTVSYIEGAHRGPENLIEASAFVELFDEKFKVVPHLQGIATLEVEHLLGEHHENLLKIGENYLDYFSQEKFVIGVGGEHSVTIGILAKLYKKLGNTFSVLQFDAHTDLRQEFEGSEYSHACVMRRVSENLDNFVQVGIRSMCEEEYDFVESSAYTGNILFAQDIYEMSAEEIARHILSSLKHDAVYLTFDVDYFDLAVIRSTGTPEPGGPDWYKTLKILEIIFREKNVIGADVVELIGDEEVSAFNAALLVKKLIVLKNYTLNTSR